MSAKMKPRERKKKEGWIEISDFQVYQSDSCQHCIKAEKRELFIFTAELDRGGGLLAKQGRGVVNCAG